MLLYKKKKMMCQILNKKIKKKKLKIFIYEL